MPGGSVNGRPFRENPNSYIKSGVPCGNPKRYATKDVIRMTSGVHPSTRSSLSGPAEEIETEGEKQLKELARKQIETKITLDEQFSRHRVFTEKFVRWPLANELKGTVSLNRYLDITNRDDYEEELKMCGLTDEEISHKLQSEGLLQKWAARQSKYGVDPIIQQQRLKEIERKIQEKSSESKTNSFSGAKSVSRHEMELEKVLMGNRDNAKLLGCLLTVDRKPSSIGTACKDHPMNHIMEILEMVTKRSYPKRHHKDASSPNKRQRVAVSRDDSISQTAEVVQNLDEQQQNSVPAGLEASENTSGIVSESCDSFTSEEKDKKMHSPRQLSHKIIPLSREEIRKSCLTVEEIKKLPHFQNYDAGEVNNVLYLKNLSSKMSEADLVSLFLRFQKDNDRPIFFKMLTGRMRGQAFVTFDSPQTAQAALELVNGYQFKGKPIIIQYGRKKS